MISVQEQPSVYHLAVEWSRFPGSDQQLRIPSWKCPWHRTAVSTGGFLCSDQTGQSIFGTWAACDRNGNVLRYPTQVYFYVPRGRCAASYEASMLASISTPYLLRGKKRGTEARQKRESRSCLHVCSTRVQDPTAWPQQVRPDTDTETYTWLLKSYPKQRRFLSWGISCHHLTPKSLVFPTTI